MPMGRNIRQKSLPETLSGLPRCLCGQSKNTTVPLSDIEAGWWHIVGRPSITFAKLPPELIFFSYAVTNGNPYKPCILKGSLSRHCFNIKLVCTIIHCVHSTVPFKSYSFPDRWPSIMHSLVTIVCLFSCTFASCFGRFLKRIYSGHTSPFHPQLHLKFIE